eukprot:90695_1
MASSLTFLLSMFSYIHANGYTQSTEAPIRVFDHAWSGTHDDALSYVSCPSSSPNMISCGLDSDHAHIDGSHHDKSSDTCVAQNGENGTGSLAIALCVSDDYTCTSYNGSLSNTISNTKSTATVQCIEEDEVMVSCSPYTNSGSIYGAYVGTQFENTTVNSDTLCTAHSQTDEAGNGVSAEGICCKYNADDGYELDCKTEWGSEVSNGDGVSTASCDTDSGYVVWGCSGYSQVHDSLAAYYHGYVRDSSGNITDHCRALSLSDDPVQAVATCCRLHKDVTELDVVKNNASAPITSELWFVWVILGSALVFVICIGCIVDKVVLCRSKKKVLRDPKPKLECPKAPSIQLSLDISNVTRPPGTGANTITMFAPGRGEKSIELDIDRDRDSESNSYDLYHTPITIGDTKMTSLPLPDSPRDDEDSDSDQLYEPHPSTQTGRKTDRMSSLPREASRGGIVVDTRMKSLPLDELSHDDSDYLEEVCAIGDLDDLDRMEPLDEPKKSWAV